MTASLFFFDLRRPKKAELPAGDAARSKSGFNGSVRRTQAREATGQFLAHQFPMRAQR